MAAKLGIFSRPGLVRQFLQHTRCSLTAFSGTRQFSTTQHVRNDKVYEVRTYIVQAKEFKQFMELSKQWMHLRTSHSKMIGYWTSEIGGINDVVHIWEYDSLSHRAGVRQALAGDPLWVGNYFSNILPMLVRQENSLMKCLPGTGVSNPPGKGVYEIQQFSYGDSDLGDVSPVLQNVQKSGASLLGSFYTLIGNHSTGCQLWYHPNVDNLIQDPVKVPQSSGIKFGHSRLLLPVPWSDMQ